MELSSYGSDVVAMNVVDHVRGLMKSQYAIIRSGVAITVAALALTLAAPVAQAKHGADDPAGHNAGDDHGGRKGKGAKAAAHDDKGGKANKGGKGHGGHDNKPGHK